MSIMIDSRWQRRGVSLLWGAEAFAGFAAPEEAVTMRQFFNLNASWPDTLPSSGGSALVVVGLEGCLDMLTPADAEQWLSEDFREQAARFQSEYPNEALIFWLPGGRARIQALSAREEYLWTCAAPHATERLPLGRCLWAGAEHDAQRIISPTAPDQDADGSAWIGLYHPRISS